MMIANRNVQRRFYQASNDIYIIKLFKKERNITNIHLEEKVKSFLRLAKFSANLSDFAIICQWFELGTE